MMPARSRCNRRTNRPTSTILHRSCITFQECRYSAAPASTNDYVAAPDAGYQRTTIAALALLAAGLPHNVPLPDPQTGYRLCVQRRRGFLTLLVPEPAADVGGGHGAALPARPARRPSHAALTSMSNPVDSPMTWMALNEALRSSAKTGGMETNTAELERAEERHPVRTEVERVPVARTVRLAAAIRRDVASRPGDAREVSEAGKPPPAGPSSTPSRCFSPSVLRTASSTRVLGTSPASTARRTAATAAGRSVGISSWSAPASCSAGTARTSRASRSSRARPTPTESRS